MIKREYSLDKKFISREFAQGIRDLEEKNQWIHLKNSDIVFNFQDL